MLLRSIFISTLSVFLLSSCADRLRAATPKVYYKTFSLKAAQDPSYRNVQPTPKTKTISAPAIKPSSSGSSSNSNRFRLPK